MPNRSADVVVIGGGVVGTAIAYFLVRNNMDVILVDKGAITAGTSGRCEGDVLVSDPPPNGKKSLSEKGGYSNPFCPIGEKIVRGF